jgi:hypothetical protein
MAAMALGIRSDTPVEVVSTLSSAILRRLSPHQLHGLEDTQEFQDTHWLDLQSSPCHHLPVTPPKHQEILEILEIPEIIIIEIPQPS